MRRHLVVNADDFGLTVGVNDGILAAHESGILTSASLFANAPATDDAIRRARTFSSLGVGVHLTLVDGRPALSPQQVPTLVGEDGQFRSTWKPFIAACLRGRVSLGEIERELTAQIERLQGVGLTLTHLDTHKHVHAFPPVFAVVCRLAKRFNLPVVRVPYERWLPSAVAQEARAPRRTARRQAWLNAATWLWAQRNYREAASMGLRTPRLIGLVHTGILNPGALRTLVHHADSGVTELMVHPGFVDDALRRVRTRLLDSRQHEVALLCSLASRALLVGERIDLVRHDLAHPARRSFRHVS
jgi:hopanoid biosynthesis associated protein HpnK